jgi:hypothetical protein
VNGPNAAGLVFPPNVEYDLFFSGRYVEDLVTGKATKPDPEQRSDRIYIGFAVHRGVLGPHTDIHHLRPADVTCNSDRGDLDFDESEFARAECASRCDADSFEPRDTIKGDVGRILFYMDVGHAGDDGVPDLALVDDDSNSGPLLGHLCTSARLE